MLRWDLGAHRSPAALQASTLGDSDFEDDFEPSKPQQAQQAEQPAAKPAGKQPAAKQPAKQDASPEPMEVDEAEGGKKKGALGAQKGV